MKEMTKKLLSIIALSTAAVGAQAGMISDYSVMAGNNYVTNSATGQQWLKWTETSGMSVTEAVTAYQSEGWRVASNADMALLFGDFYGKVLGTNENATRVVHRLRYGDGVDASQTFGDLFGWTAWKNSTYVPDGSVTPWHTRLSASYAWFGTGADGDGLHNRAYVQSESLCWSCGFVSYRPERAILFAERKSVGAHGVGVALLRDAQTAAVPEPGTLALLGLGIFGLSYARKRSQA
jgi:NAD-dependent dihydropyrimidine dehydrogenase PreA subunit